MCVNKFFSFFLFLLLPFQLFSQGISGKIQFDNEPLPHAHILLNPSKIHTLSKADGSFSFEKLSPGSYELIVTYVAMEDYHLKINLQEDQFFVIEMKEARELLDELTLASHNEFTDETLQRRVMRQEELENHSAENLSATLNREPGITSIQTGTGIAKPVIRGLSFARVQVNSDGIKQEGQQWGADHGLELDQFDVARVELVKGPGTLMYGSDGMGGVISVRSHLVPKLNTLLLEHRSIYKTNNKLYGSSTSVQLNKNNRFLLGRFSTQDYSDYRVPADRFNYNRYILPLEGERLKNTAGRERNYSLFGGWLGDWGKQEFGWTSYHLTTGIFPGAIGVPRAASLLSDGDDTNIDVPLQDVEHNKLTASTILNAEKGVWEINAAWQRNKRKERSLPHLHGQQIAIPDSTLALGLDLDTYSLNVRFEGNDEHEWHHKVGGDIQYQNNEISGFEYLLAPYRTLRSGIYDIVEYHASERLHLSGGLRFDYGFNKTDRINRLLIINQTDSIYQGSKAVDETYLNYSASLGFNYSLDEDAILKWNLGRTFRIPSPSETSSNGVHHGTFRHELGNPDLKSEKGIQTDLAVIRNKGKWYTNLALFYNYFEDYIYLSPSGSFLYEGLDGELYSLPEAGQVYQYKQNDAMFLGFEYIVDYRINKKLSIQHNAEYVWNTNLDESLALPFTPPASVKTALRYESHYKKWKGLYAEFSTAYFFEQNRTDRNELATPDAFLVDISAGGRYSLGKQEIICSIQLRNAFDRTYLNHLSRYRLLNLPEQGRNLVLSIKLPFHHHL